MPTYREPDVELYPLNVGNQMFRLYRTVGKSAIACDVNLIRTGT